jgi:hypothetical protein
MLEKFLTLVEMLSSLSTDKMLFIVSIATAAVAMTALYVVLVAIKKGNKSNG